MGVARGPNPIVTDGLVFAIDPANHMSYSSSAAICTNLVDSSIKGNMNGTLTGSFGPNISWNFSSSYGGTIDPSGGNKNYITANNASSHFNTDWTISTWIRPALDDYIEGPDGRVIWSFHTAADVNRLICFI